jgi:hypothetical protein
MLVSKNNIKIILLLIFVLVIYQISKTSPTNYVAYGLVAIGFYLVYTEIKVEEFIYLKEKMTEDGIVANQPSDVLPDVTPEINESTEVVDNTDEQMLQAQALQTDRTAELEELKKALIKPEDVEVKNQACDCNTAIAKAIAPLQTEVSKLRSAQKVTVSETEAKVKTYQLLVDILQAHGILKSEDIQSLKSKMTSGLLTIDEAISRLEKMKLVAKEVAAKPDASNKSWWNDMNKSELPAAMYLPLGSQINQDFSNEYTILNTEKWTVPMPRPPVCIDSTPKEIMPVGTSGYPLSVKYFDDSRYVSTSSKTEQAKKEMEETLKE